MRKSPWLLWIGTWAMSIGAIGCANSGSSSDGPGLDLTVAPLDLPLATDACYQIKVWNAEDPVDGEVVWEQTALCASQYGANNGIRFTGLCDADAPGGINSVRLILNDIYTGGTFETGTALTAGTDYINPCAVPGTGEDNGCVLTAQCDPNQDTKVEFNLTVMRQAQLGFFDTVVRLDDLFCAAKLDCVDQDNNTLTYLYNPAAQADDETAVLGFTCLGGSGAAVSMYLDDVVITCRDSQGTITRTATVNPSQGPGNVVPAQTGASDFLFGAAVNTGEGFQGSRFWNVLLGLNGSVAGETCTLSTVGTVSETALTGTPFETRANTRYPYIEWDVDLSVDGARVCSRHPLNGGNGVSTLYTGIDTPETFTHRLSSAVTSPLTVEAFVPELSDWSPDITSNNGQNWMGVRAFFEGVDVSDQATLTVTPLEPDTSPAIPVSYGVEVQPIPYPNGFWIGGSPVTVPILLYTGSDAGYASIRTYTLTMTYLTHTTSWILTIRDGEALPNVQTTGGDIHEYSDTLAARRFTLNMGMPFVTEDSVLTLTHNSTGQVITPPLVDLRPAIELHAHIVDTSLPVGTYTARYTHTPTGLWRTWQYRRQ